MVKKPRDEMTVSAVDQNYPLIIFVIILITSIVITRCHTINLESAFRYMLSATITWASVLLGFIGVLLGVLFNLLNSDLIKTLFEYATRNTLKRYFYEALIAGVLLILTSMVLFVCLHQLLFSFWLAFGPLSVCTGVASNLIR